MISKEEESYILSRAYVPEHIPKMMSFLSDGEPFLIEQDYLIFLKHDSIILIGYPLDSSKRIEDHERCIKIVIKRFDPSHMYIVSESGSSGFFKQCNKIDEDFYYIIDLEKISLDRGVLKIIQKATKRLTIRIDNQETEMHKRLTQEFLSQKNLKAGIKELYIKLPAYMRNSEGIFYISAYSEDGVLTGYYIVENEAERFSAYMIGCMSKKDYVPYTSDYLMYELINISREMGKKYINLGIGVNEGIRRFKEKWGGVKSLKYEVFEYRGTSSLLSNLFFKKN